MTDYWRTVSRRKFSLTREAKPEEPVSRLTVIGYSLPWIGLFLILCCFLIDPIAIWLVLAGWWLALIILISLLVTFFRAMQKGGILKKTILILSAVNLAVLLLWIAVLSTKTPLFVDILRFICYSDFRA